MMQIKTVVVRNLTTTEWAAGVSPLEECGVAAISQASSNAASRQAW